jgi:hypothetical protein
MRTGLVRLFSEIVKPGPTVPVSFGSAFGDAPPVADSASATAAETDSQPTVNDPFIEVKCGSQTKV